ncbi:hypothetical protein AC578_8874 [Pseudocercospora eumusae]|uniref:Uncharacterized protein n=1 Tax=Pseudocercospora eumusae TaxID=321146 RepID=A0A139HBK4_9PEZI|nr:hypothetical protein AC578_8874 [Pseudocercospora eumusae]
MGPECYLRLASRHLLLQHSSGLSASLSTMQFSTILSILYLSLGVSAHYNCKMNGYVYGLCVGNGGDTGTYYCSQDNDEYENIAVGGMLVELLGRLYSTEEKESI